MTDRRRQTTVDSSNAFRPADSNRPVHHVRIHRLGRRCVLNELCSAPSLARELVLECRCGNILDSLGWCDRDSCFDHSGRQTGQHSSPGRKLALRRISMRVFPNCDGTYVICPQHLLDRIIRHEPDAGLQSVPDNQSSGARVQSPHAMGPNCFRQDGQHTFRLTISRKRAELMRSTHLTRRGGELRLGLEELGWICHRALDGACDDAGEERLVLRGLPC